MMRRIILVAPLLVFAAMAVFFLVTLESTRVTGPQSPLIGKPAPVLALGGVEGAGVPGLASADIQGRVVVVNVFASWCTPCRIEHPLMNELAAKNIVPIIGMNYKDPPDAARKWLAELGDPYKTTFIDFDGKLGIDFGVYGVPETFVIDKQGVIRYKHIGPVTPEAMQKKIVPLVQELQKS